MGRLLDEDIVIDALISISGSKSIEELTEECEVYQSDNRCWSGGVYGAIRAIKNLLTAQPEPQEGHWILVAGDLECSKCHTRYPDLYPDYDNSVACPHCGCKMEVEHETD